MNEKQRQARLKRWGEYRGSTYRRWRVYSTFLTGFLIGLFYVLLISGQFLIGLDEEGQKVLVLIFSGILGGVIYSIVVDGNVEMPRFVAGKGDLFEAGLFGDILLGIAGAVVLDYVRQQFGVELNSSIDLAAAGIVGGYGGRAILEFALTRVFKDINLLEADRQKYLQTSFQQRLERGDSLKLIDQLNQQVRVGLVSSELAELTAAIKQASADVSKRVFNLAQEFRRSAHGAGEKSRVERTIPIFEALIESDPQQHQYYAELAFAYKDSDSPDLFKVIQYLDKAIALRGNQQRAETWNYELSRAITRIQEAYKASNTYDFESAVHERIIADLLAVAEIYNLENILREASDQTLPVPVINWMQHNQTMLAAHPKASVLIKRLDSMVSTETALSQPKGISAAPLDSSTQAQTSGISSPADIPSPIRQMPNTVIPGIAPVKPAVPESAVPKEGIALIKEFEGYHKKLPDGRVEAYPDTIHGWKVPTIGYGTTRYPDGRKVQKGDIITQAEAEQYLLAEVEHRCKSALEKIPTWKQMNRNQRAALYSFAYNLGPGFYGSGSDFSSITSCCDSPEKWSDKAWIESQFVKYRNPGTSAENGLRRRRLAEASLFCTPSLNNTVVSTSVVDNKEPNGRTAPKLPIALAGVVPLVQMDTDAVRWVKQQLARGGYYKGTIDGIVDEPMLSAFKAFKAAFFLDNPEQIGPATVSILAKLPEPTSTSDITLSQNFKLSELIMSETAARKGINNYPDDPAVIENLKAVCEKILEPVRSHFNKPITPNSGYRGKALNKAIKGATTSQHMVGEAVDFVVPGVLIPEVCAWIRNNLVFDQLIMEHYNPRTQSGWVHCSYRRNGKNRRQFFTIP